MREGFIPPQKEHELQRLLNIPEDPYLRKYPSLERHFGGQLFKMPVNPALHFQSCQAFGPQHPRLITPHLTRH
jgi:hypothetical protein